jgi:hypothetical protein
MIVAFLITLFALWLILSPQGRERIAGTTRSRPGYAAWMGLGFVLLMVCFWGMLLPALRSVEMAGPGGPTEVWRVAAWAFLGWAAVSGAAWIARGRL